MFNRISNENKSKYYFKAVPDGQKARKSYSDYRNHKSEKTDVFTGVKVAAGATAGAVLPVLYFLKKRDGKIKGIKQFFSLEYGFKEMMTVSLGAITGGVLAGIAGEKNKVHKKRKLDEGVFQFMNTAVPTTLVCGAIKLCEKIKPLNHSTYKMIGTGAGLISGMYLGAEISNKINDPKDKVPDRKLTMKDAIANVDDAFGALVIAKFPGVKHLHVEKALPVIFSWCGYRAGQSN